MNKLKTLRKEKGLSQQALGKAIGVSYRTVQNWENGVNQIKPDKAQILADYFGVDIAYLLGYQRTKDFSKESFLLGTEGHISFTPNENRYYTEKELLDYDLFFESKVLEKDFDKLINELAYFFPALTHQIQNDTFSDKEKDQLKKFASYISDHRKGLHDMLLVIETLIDNNFGL